MFKGFTEEADRFLMELRLNNNQQFFEANRERYEQVVKMPLRELCEELAPTVALIDPKLDTRPMRSMSRIRRDTRFTRDKSPYRDHFWLAWRYPGKRMSEGFGMYYGYGIDWMGWGCGSYAPDKPLTDALRAEMRRNPDGMKTVFCDNKLTERFALYGEDYAKLRVPEEIPEQLRSVYIKRCFGFETVPFDGMRELARSHELADRLKEDLLRMAPLFRLMQQLRARADFALEEAQREKEEAMKEEARLAGAVPVKGKPMEEFDF